MAKILMKGNEALAEAAIRAGCKAFFGYPITPQNEVPGYMADQLPLRGGVYLQAESEVAAINMVYGAAGAGARVMTSSSSPGISLKQEGISYIAAAELPCVIANVVRCGPGLGGIQPSQGDYFQAVKGGGHGDYRLIVLAPGSVQEMAELTTLAFDLADKWRNPVMILSDGILGQMMEPVEFPEDYQPLEVEKPWATTGAKGRERNIVNTLDIIPESLEKKVEKLLEKYERIKREEVRWKEEGTEDAEIILVGYGTSARIARSAMEQARQKGLKVGLFRPITLFPFPEERLRALAGPGRQFLAVEMSAGQMIEDVRLAVEGRSPVHLCRRLGGMVPTPEDVLAKIQELVEGEGQLMKTVFQKPQAMTDAQLHYCPGCTHGIIHRLVAEAIDALDIREQTIGIASVGCSVFAYDYFNCDMQQAAHGRAPAVATGIKRVLPESIVFTYQGDGDLASIGMAEIVHAAARGENITVIFINNAIYGMTSGQMAPTTLPGQVTATSPRGRSVNETGYPIRICELLVALEGAAYLARVSSHNPRHILQAGRAIKKAFEVQQQKQGFALVEVLSTCSVNWGMAPVKAMQWLEENMIPYYPLGVFKDVTAKEGEQHG